MAEEKVISEQAEDMDVSRMKALEERQIVRGTVVRVDSEGVLVVDRPKGRVILSHKNAVTEERAKAREELLASLEEGQVREGIVRRLTDFGAFVDLGGIDGLLPISEMSWTYIKHPSEVVHRGQRLTVAVLRVDREAGRISLGLKHILPDPWQHLGETYRPGQTVS